MLLVDKPLHRLRKGADLPLWPSCIRYIYCGQLSQIPDGELYGFLILVARRAEIAIAIVKSQRSAVRYERQAGRMDLLKQSHHDFTWKTASYRHKAADSIPWQLARDAAQLKVDRCYEQGVHRLFTLSDHLWIQMDELAQLVHPVKGMAA